MREEYVSEAEDIDYFETLAGLLGRIAETLPLKKDMRILDVATGCGYFSEEMAKRWRGIIVTGMTSERETWRNTVWDIIPRSPFSPPDERKGERFLRVHSHENVRFQFGKRNRCRG